MTALDLTKIPRGDRLALAEALAGLIPISGGDIVVSGISIASRRSDGSVARDVAYIPERPIDNAVVANLDLSTNLLLRAARDLPFFPRRAEIERQALELIASYDVRPPTPTAVASALSGGNLQKLVIARELSDNPRVVIACYPTMGLDVLAAQSVYRELFRHAAEGACVVWISEELDDLMSYAHRIAVIHNGEIAGIVRRKDASRQVLGEWMAGHTAEAA